MITVEQATKALEEIVAEYGEDYIYPGSSNPKQGCIYRDEYGQPSCIVGHVLSRLEPEAFESISAVENPLRLDAIGARRVLDKQILEDALNHLQSAQDAGETWGAAFRSYKYFLEGQGVSVD